MIRSSKLALLGLVVAALAGFSSVAEAQGITVDANLAKRGKTLWQNRGCMGCHSIGKGRLAGPDLAGVTERRSMDWLKRWLKNTEEMLANDSAAQAMLAEANGIKLPQVKLTDADIDAVLHYIVQETEKKKGS